jgi:hypothetical protein
MDKDLASITAEDEAEFEIYLCRALEYMERAKHAEKQLRVCDRDDEEDIEHDGQ